MSDGLGLAEALLGLDGFRVLDVREVPDEIVITVETMLKFVGSLSWGPDGASAPAYDSRHQSRTTRSGLRPVERGQRNLSLHNILTLAYGLDICPAKLVRGLQPPED